MAISLDSAVRFLIRHEGQDPPPAGARFAIGLQRDHALVAAAVLGDPVPPARDDSLTIEITRAGTSDATTVTLVTLYQYAWRLAQAHGYQRLITHTPVFAREITYGLHHVGLRPAAGLPPRAASHTPIRLRVGRGVDGVCRIHWEPRRKPASRRTPVAPAGSLDRHAGFPAARAVSGRCA